MLGWTPLSDLDVTLRVRFLDSQLEMFGQVVNEIHKSMNVNAHYTEKKREADGVKEGILFHKERLVSQYNSALTLSMLLVAFATSHQFEDPLKTSSDFYATLKKILIKKAFVPVSRMLDFIENSSLFTLEDTEGNRSAADLEKDQAALIQVGQFLHKVFASKKLIGLSAPWRRYGFK